MKILNLYFSATGNTAKAAQCITATVRDIFSQNEKSDGCFHLQLSAGFIS